MESLRRSILLLKAEAPGGGRATLKLMSGSGGTTVDLRADGLAEGEYTLFIFDKDAKAHRAGELKGRELSAKLSVPAFDDIAAAAVADARSGAFVLKSLGIDWDQAATQFRLSRVKESPAPAPRMPIPDFSAAESMPMPDFSASESMPYKEEPEIVMETPPDTMETPEPDLAPVAGPEACGTCPHVIRQDRINPFPAAFPHSEWVRISYPGPAGWWHYISGKIYRGDTLIAKVLGVPGEYGMAPPIWLEGFGTYMRCTSGDASGYWLMFQDAQTGEVLDMGLSPHGG